MITTIICFKFVPTSTMMSMEVSTALGADYAGWDVFAVLTLGAGKNENIAMENHHFYSIHF